MAEYKALAQNTYKFVREVVLQNNGAIDTPIVANMPKIKVIRDGELQYIPLQYGDDTSAVSCGRTLFMGDVSSTGAWKQSQALEWLCSTQGMPWEGCGLQLHRKCIVDGAVYHGLASATFFFREWSGSTVLGDTKTIKGLAVPACTVKYVRYVANSDCIEAATYDMADVSGAAVTATDTKYAMACAHYHLQLAKADNDIILAISIEYPKYNITLSGSAALQYSTDDGATFQDITDGVVLDSVEHVVFKNTSDSATCYVGTTVGGSDLASIAAGGTFCVPTTEDATWYIS